MPKTEIYLSPLQSTLKIRITSNAQTYFTEILIYNFKTFNKICNKKRK